MSDLLREKVIPVLWLVLALFIPAFGVAAVARGDDLSPRVVAYVNAFHDSVCTTLDDVPTVAGVEGVVLAVMGAGFTGGEAGQIVAASVLVYCPEHSVELQAFADKWAPADRWVTA